MRSRQLESLSHDFDFLAETDPMYAVLHGKNKRRRQWDPDEFFATGQHEVEDLLSRARRLGFPQGKDAALDFGSGLGRLSRALADHFDNVLGVDISPRMVDMATTIHKDNLKLRFVLNPNADLRTLDDNQFDLIYSNKVLQHQPTADLVLSYLREFVRVLKPGGLLAAQVPEKTSLLYKLFNRRRQFLLLQRLGVNRRRLLDQLGLHPVRMICLERSEVASAIETSGGRLLAVERYLPEGPTYFATKTGARG